MRKALLSLGCGVGLAMLLTAMITIRPLAAPQEMLNIELEERAKKQAESPKLLRRSSPGSE